MGFQLDPDYKQVPERIADFKAKHPEGSLRPLNPERPFWVEAIGESVFVCYAAAAFRTPDDQAPGVGMAWEPFPGTTPYTRNSELQNAETSAWGRAIVAVLASESKSVASAEDIRNRQEDAPVMVDPLKVKWTELRQATEAAGLTPERAAALIVEWFGKGKKVADLDIAQLDTAILGMKREGSKAPEQKAHEADLAEKGATDGN